MDSKFRLRWPVDTPRITQYFGENPQIYAKFNQAGHEGIDFGVPVGSDIYASADGEVFDVRPDDGNAYGVHVRLHADCLSDRILTCHVDHLDNADARQRLPQLRVARGSALDRID